MEAVGGETTSILRVADALVHEDPVVVHVRATVVPTWLFDGVNVANPSVTEDMKPG
jgi:hypothetical protein